MKPCLSAYISLIRGFIIYELHSFECKTNGVKEYWRILLAVCGTNKDLLIVLWKKGSCDIFTNYQQNTISEIKVSNSILYTLCVSRQWQHFHASKYLHAILKSTVVCSKSGPLEIWQSQWSPIFEMFRKILHGRCWHLENYRNIVVFSKAHHGEEGAN